MTQQRQHACRRNDEVSLDRKVGRMGMLVHRYHEAKAHRRGGMGDPLRGQGRVLALLGAKPETTQRELSYLLDMRQQSLSELLAKLEEKGFVTREKSAEDGRVTVVRLTDAGAEAAPSPEQMQRRTDALDFLTDDEQEQLESLADKVTETLEARLAEMGVDPHQGPGRKGGRGRGCDGSGGRGHDCDGSGVHGHGHGHDCDGSRHGGRGHGHGCDGNGGHGHGHGCEGGGGRRHGMRRGPYRLEEQEDGHTWQA